MGYGSVNVGSGSVAATSIKVKQFTTLPTIVENNIIAIISTTPLKNYIVDTRKPSVSANGDVWAMVEDTTNSLSQGDGANGVVTMRFGAVKQHKNGVWRMIDAFIGTNGAWVRISNTNEIYGIKIDKNNSDPLTRVTYTGAAAGMKPCKMNYATGEFDYGDWYDFICKLATPVMLNNNGTVAYELDRNNQNKKADGTASDIAKTTFAGNAMVKLRKIYIQAYSDSKYDYINFSFDNLSEAYNAFAFTNQAGIEQDFIYMPMFRGSYIGGKIRSIANQVPMASNTATVEIAGATANGNGYYTQYWSVWNLKMSLLWLVGKSTNTQETFGQGNSNSPGALQTGTLTTKGAFWGYKETTKQVKCFWSEVMWGDQFDRIMGCVSNASKKLLIKMTPPYNASGTGYTDIGAYTNMWLKDVTLTENGMLPDVTATGGSDTTYFSDYVYMNATCYGGVGGYYGLAGYCGASFLYVYEPVSSSGAPFGASLFYVKP